MRLNSTCAVGAGLRVGTEVGNRETRSPRLRTSRVPYETRSLKLRTSQLSSIRGFMCDRSRLE
jgi:hypothetical protein